MGPVHYGDKSDTDRRFTGGEKVDTGVYLQTRQQTRVREGRSGMVGETQSKGGAKGAHEGVGKHRGLGSGMENVCRADGVGRWGNRAHEETTSGTDPSNWRTTAGHVTRTLRRNVGDSLRST